jgi:hypothetical protein
MSINNNRKRDFNSVNPTEEANGGEEVGTTIDTKVPKTFRVSYNQNLYYAGSSSEDTVHDDICLTPDHSDEVSKTYIVHDDICLTPDQSDDDIQTHE